MTLRKQIEQAANVFASEVLAALRTASLDELVSITGQKTKFAPTAAASSAAASSSSSSSSNRLRRRSAQDLASTVEAIAGLLAQNPKGLRAEQIRDALGVEAKVLPRPLKEGLSAGRFKKAGEKRSTVYTLSSKGAGAPKKRAGKK